MDRARSPARWRKAPPGPAVAIWCAALGIAAAAAQAQSVADWADVPNPGGTFSVYSYGQAPYNRSAPFLSLEERMLFSKGADAFANPSARNGDLAPAAVQSASANAATCAICHLKNGRGRTHAADLGATGFSVVNARHEGAARVFRAPAPSDPGAARLTTVRWTLAERIILSGGETVELVRPVALVDGVERPVDLRNASGVYGLGLLESIPEADIVESAKIRAYEMFGIAGLVPVATGSGGSPRIGRFGWKATFATLADQVRNAMKTELGIVAPGSQDRSGPEDPDYAALASDLTLYLRLLAVPARRLEGNGAYRHGASLFAQTGCAMCHVPSWRTGRTPDLAEEYRDLTIFPFTDMLLHDMGRGLSDHSAGGLSRHWRTAPLWGIGVQHGVSREVGFLHDGRARTLTEAILWHGGEAGYAVDRFKALTPRDRAAMIAFLSSL